MLNMYFRRRQSQEKSGKAEGGVDVQDTTADIVDPLPV